MGASMRPDPAVILIVDRQDRLAGGDIKATAVCVIDDFRRLRSIQLEAADDLQFRIDGDDLCRVL